MTAKHDADAEQPAEGVHLEAHLLGNARAYQAGRDLHIRYESDGLAARKVQVTDVVEECPYPGLAAFGPEDARWFFGRDALLAELTGLLSEQPPGLGPVVLVASSGAGKSSLLRAGLMPALEDGVLPQAGSRRWPRLLFTPTAHPLAALAAQLSPIVGTSQERVSALLADDPDRAADLINTAVSMGQIPGNGVTVLVDQLEETFTLCDDETERRVFVETLCAIGSAADPGASLVVLSLRADFYQNACTYPRLRAALRDRQLLMGPMSTAELRQAIVAPSQAVGLELEPGLVELLVRDLGGTRGNGSSSAEAASYEAGRLPLLAHALRATWQQRHGHVLTVDGYVATGGIPHAIAASAERTFGRMDGAEQELARMLFLRMVRIGDRTEDTRRQVAHAELVQDSGDPAVAEAAIDAFTRARLLTHERDSVEITHEALLREWPRLRGWIDTDHAGRLVQQEIEEQAAAWEAAGRDASRLYRGGQLDTVTAWAATSASRAELTSRARAFLAASVRQKRRTTLLRRGVVAALTVLVLAASSLAAIALVQDHAAIRERDQAVFNEVSSEASSLTSTNPSLAAQFDLAAYRMKPTPGLYTSLINTEAEALATPLGAVPAPLPAFSSIVTFGPGGRVLAGAGGRTIRLWSITGRERATPLGSLPGLGGNVESVSISPDGRTLAAGLSNGTVRMWDIADPARPSGVGKPLHIPLATAGVEAAFDPHGQVLLVWLNWKRYGVVELWDVSQPAKPRYLNVLAPCAAVDSVTLSTDGDRAAVGCSDGKVHLADVTNPARPQVQGWMQASTDDAAITSLAFSPDGRTLVSAAYSDQTFSLWSVANPSRPTSLGSPVDWLNNGVYSASFSPDGPVLATSDHDGTVQLWNIADPASVDDLGPPMTADSGPALDVAFSPDGQTIAVGYVDGTMRLWSIPHPLVTANGNGETDGIAYSADGHLLASSNNESDTLNLWEITGRSEPRRASSPEVCASGKSQGTELIAFAPRSPVLAAGCFGGFRLWDVADPFHVTALSPWLASTPENSWVNSVAFDHSGKILAATGNGYVTLWNVADTAHPAEVASLNMGMPDEWMVASISPDGRTLAVGVGTTVRLWNITNPAKPRLIAERLPGPTQWITYIRFSHSGDTLAAASADDNIYLWNTATPHPGASVRTLTGHTDLVAFVAFSPDDRTIASSSYDKTVRLWNAATAGPLGNQLTGHTDYALGVAFSPLGHTLASIGYDDTVYLWDLDVHDAISRICAATAGILTPSQWHQDLPGVPYRPPCGTS